MPSSPPRMPSSPPRMPSSPFDAKSPEAKLWTVPLEERRRIGRKAKLRQRKVRLVREREAREAAKQWLREALAKENSSTRSICKGRRSKPSANSKHVSGRRLCS